MEARTCVYALTSPRVHALLRDQGVRFSLETIDTAVSPICVDFAAAGAFMRAHFYFYASSAVEYVAGARKTRNRDTWDIFVIPMVNVQCLRGQSKGTAERIWRCLCRQRRPFQRRTRRRQQQRQRPAALQRHNSADGLSLTFLSWDALLTRRGLPKSLTMFMIWGERGRRMEARRHEEEQIRQIIASKGFQEYWKETAAGREAEAGTKQAGSECAKQKRARERATTSSTTAARPKTSTLERSADRETAVGLCCCLLQPSGPPLPAPPPLSLLSFFSAGTWALFYIVSRERCSTYTHTTCTCSTCNRGRHSSTLIAYSASSSLRNSTNPKPWWTPVILSFGMCTFATGPAWIISCEKGRLRCDSRERPQARQPTGVGSGGREVKDRQRNRLKLILVDTDFLSRNQFFDRKSPHASCSWAELGTSAGIDHS